MTTGSYTFGGGANDAIYVSKYWSGGNDPKHRTPQDYTMRMARWSRVPYALIDRKTGAILRSENYVVGGAMPPVISRSMEVEAQAKLADAVRQHSFNAAVFAAELPEAIGQVVNICYGLGEVVRGVRQKDYRRILRGFARLPGQVKPGQAKRAVKAHEIGGAWLALKYGLEPTLKDLYSMMEAIEARNRERSLTYRSSKTWSYVADDSVSPSTYKVPCRMRRSLRLKITVKEKLSFPRSLGLLDPMSVIWEKIPFSFILDWMVPIGTYLDNLSILGSLDATYERCEFAFAESRLGSPLSTPTVYGLGGSIEARRCQLSRTVSKKIPVTLPGRKTWSRVFSLPHLQNAAALVFSFIAGGRRTATNN